MRAHLFTVQATNQIGNVSQKSYSWTIDRTKPAAVANFRARARDASVLLEWKKPVDADYDHVVIGRKRAGTTSWKTLAKRVNATSLKDTAVRNDVRYRYRIRSVDRARNLRPRSRSVAVRARSFRRSSKRCSDRRR